MIDNRIPKTLEDARKMTGIRFHEWDEQCRQLAQDYLNGGVVRDDDTFSLQNTSASAIEEYAQKIEEGRLGNVIARIATKLVY